MNAHWTEADIEVNGVQLHYYRTGQGDKPPFVLIHGFSDTGLLWTQTARDLAVDYDVIMPDMRGHGRSTRVQLGDDEAARAQVDRLTPALLAKAFRSELVPQDPADEPAAVLLERLRGARAQAKTVASTGVD